MFVMDNVEARHNLRMILTDGFRNINPHLQITNLVVVNGLDDRNFLSVDITVVHPVFERPYHHVFNLEDSYLYKDLSIYEIRDYFINHFRHHFAGLNAGIRGDVTILHYVFVGAIEYYLRKSADVIRGYNIEVGSPEGRQIKWYPIPESEKIENPTPSTVFIGQPTKIIAWGYYEPSKIHVLEPDNSPMFLNSGESAYRLVKSIEKIVKAADDATISKRFKIDVVPPLFNSTASW